MKSSSLCRGGGTFLHHSMLRLIADAWFVQNNGLQHVLQKCMGEKENERARDTRRVDMSEIILFYAY